MIDQKLQCHGSGPDLAPITTNNSLADIVLICLAFKGVIAYSKTACKRAYIPCSSTFLQLAYILWSVPKT
jgi:hypothetical protein